MCAPPCKACLYNVICDSPTPLSIYHTPTPHSPLCARWSWRERVQHAAATAVTRKTRQTAPSRDLQTGGCWELSGVGLTQYLRGRSSSAGFYARRARRPGESVTGGIGERRWRESVPQPGPGQDSPWTDRNRSVPQRAAPVSRGRVKREARSAIRM